MGPAKLCLMMSADGFRDQANPENRLPGFVEHFHLPFGILLQAARNAAEQIAADLGHFGPRGLAALEFGTLIGRAGVAAMADPEKIQRHDNPNGSGPPPGLFDRDVAMSVATEAGIPHAVGLR